MLFGIYPEELRPGDLPLRSATGARASPEAFRARAIKLGPDCGPLVFVGLGLTFDSFRGLI